MNRLLIGPPFRQIVLSGGGPDAYGIGVELVRTRFGPTHERVPGFRANAQAVTGSLSNRDSDHVRPSAETAADKIDFTDPEKLAEAWKLGNRGGDNFVKHLN